MNERRRFAVFTNYLIGFSYLIVTVSQLSSAPDLCHEHQAQYDVANVGVHVVEVRQHAQGVRAEEVVVAHVLIARLEDQLRMALSFSRI